MDEKAVIIIMAKTPRIGNVKTRLRPVLTERQCAEIAACFLQDAVSKSLKITRNVVAAFSPADSRSEMENFLPDELILIAQTGADLGEKMQSAFEFAGNSGFSPIAIIGTDSPTLPAEDIEKAFAAFQNEQTKIVLGAAEDGGFYLIALRNWTDGIFDGVEWSSPKTFARTAENARRIFGNPPFEISLWRDVDTPEDLKKLAEEIAQDQSLKTLAPQTAIWLKENGFI